MRVVERWWRCREEAAKRERIRAARKDELVAQGLELVQVHDILRQEFPRAYLRGDTDARGKQQCVAGAASGRSAGASTSAAVAGVASTSAGAQLAGQEDRAAQPEHAEAAAAPPSHPVASAAAAVAQAEPVAAAAVADAPDASAAAVAEFIRAGVPAGALVHVLCILLHVAAALCSPCSVEYTSIPLYVGLQQA